MKKQNSEASMTGTPSREAVRVLPKRDLREVAGRSGDDGAEPTKRPL